MTSGIPWSRRRWVRVALRVSAVALVLITWEIAGRQNPIFASHPSAIVLAFGKIFVLELLPAIGTTLQALGVGFLIAAPAGILIGLAMGRIKDVDTILAPYVTAIYVTPRIALIPVLVLWLGIGFELRVTIVVLSALFPIILTVAAGAREVDRDLTDIGTSFLATRRQRILTILLPGTLPYIYSGVRLGLADALTGVIVAEMVAALTGLGQMIILKARLLAIDQMWVPIFTIGFLSILLTYGLARLQRFATPWLERTRATR